MPTRKPPNAKEMADLSAALRERLGKNGPGAKLSQRPPSSTAELLDSIERLAGSVRPLTSVTPSPCLTPGQSSLGQSVLGRSGLAAFSQEIHHSDSEDLDPDSQLTKTDQQLRDHFSAIVENSLAQWFTELRGSIFGKVDNMPGLKESIKSLGRSQVELQQLSATLESKQRKLVRRLRLLKKRETRLALQRKTLAQSIRAQRAELFLQVERERIAQQEQLLQVSPSDSAAKPSDDASLYHQLSHARQEILRLEEFASDARDLLEAAHAQIELLQDSPLAVLTGRESGDGDRDALALKSRLEEVLSEMADLRQQNEELATRLAAQTTRSIKATTLGNIVSHEQMTWEQRKEMILQQLDEDESVDGDTHASTDDGAQTDANDKQRLEIRRVLETTEHEIARRDREIEELREIVRTQSEARDGVAIGAAGLAAMLDTDQLIQQERQKLKDIQLEWEAKLRQAEIDLSMERAKLARERTDLEKQRTEPPTETCPAGSEKQRRWLDYLGLKEESSERAMGSSTDFPTDTSQKKR
jgi:hypothetical protein